MERIARIAEVIETSGEANEKLGRLTPEVVDKLHEQKLFHMLLPCVYGGEEIDIVTWFRAMEALAKLDGSTAWCIGQMNGCAATASALEPAIARKIWGEPRATMSWGPPMRTNTEKVDGGYRIGGEWMMASGSRHATWLGLFVPDPEEASPAAGPDAPVRIFFVPASAAEWVDSWNVIGLKATNTGGYKIRETFVPKGYSVSRDHIKHVNLPGPLYKFPLNSYFATGFSAVSLGIARAMLDTVTAIARTKNPRLAKQPLLDNHQVHFQLGEAEARLRSARGYVEATAQRIWDAVAASNELTIAQRMDIRMAATFAIHEAKAVADAAWEIAGASAIFLSSPLERRFRDIRTVTQHVQGRRSHLQEVGGFLLGLEPNLLFA